MTKPYLHIDGEAGKYDSWYFPGDSNGPSGTIVDSGARNLLPLDESMGRVALSVSGTDITSLGLSGPPELSDTADLAGEAINAGVFGVEWTATGTSEQAVSSKFQISQGDTIGVGVWVYLESPTSTDIEVAWYAFDNAGAVTESSPTTTVSVTPEEWTYITASDLVNNAASIFARVYVQANGSQSIGDKLYIGAIFGGFDETDWVFPVQPADAVMDFRFTAKILGDGTLFSSRDADGLEAEAFHIEAINEGFYWQASTIDTTTGTLTSRSYTTATNVYDYNRWYDFRIRYEKSTGELLFMVFRNGVWETIDSTTLTTTTDAFANWYGFSTIDVGLSPTTSTHAVIERFGLYDGEDFGFGYEIEGDGTDSNSALDLIGADIVVATDAVTSNYNNPLFLSHSGWIINAESGQLGALELPYRSELKYGTGDFTIVQCFTGVADEDFRPTYDDYTGGTGIKMRPSGGVFSALVGPTTHDFTTNPLDGMFHGLMLERESGVEVNGYIDDFITPDFTDADSGADLDNTEDLSIGRTPGGTAASYLSASMGVTITFTRLLTEGEKLDLQYFIESGFDYDLEPQWLRDEAVVYLNPNDPVQRAEYESRDALINLAVTPPSEIYVRYDLTSSDGVSNPKLQENEVQFFNYYLHDQNNFDAVAEGDLGRVSIPFYELGAEWINNDFTLMFWGYLNDVGVDRYILTQGPLADLNGWDLQVTSLGALEVNLGGTQLFSVAKHQPLFEKPSLVTLRREGNVWTLFVDDNQLYQHTHPDTQTLGNFPLQFDIDAVGDYEGLFIFTRAVTDGEVFAAYNAPGVSINTLLSDNVTITDGFSTQSLNWEQR